MSGVMLATAEQLAEGRAAALALLRSVAEGDYAGHVEVMLPLFAPGREAELRAVAASLAAVGGQLARQLAESAGLDVWACLGAGQ